MTVINSDSPIGLFDSGFGGLTVLRELKRALPNESYIYLGDTARLPYGPKAPETIVRYSEECVQFLLEKGVKLVVIACNTASAVALKEVFDRCPVPVIGAIEPAIQATVSLTNGRIGVIGTSTTISSGVFERRIKEINKSLFVYSKSCPLFVPYVEEGLVEGEMIDIVVRHYLTDFLSKDIDTMILGCTHYPLLYNAISRFLGDEINLVECSRSVADQVSKLLSEKRLGRTNHQTSLNEFFVTDGVRLFNRLAPFFLGTEGEIEAKLVALG